MKQIFTLLAGLIVWVSSFAQTKNIISGEGGMLVVNDKRFADRAEIIWEKGTNRSAFWRGEPVACRCGNWSFFALGRP